MLVIVLVFGLAYGFCLFVLCCLLLTGRHATEDTNTSRDTSPEATVTHRKMWSVYPRTVISEMQTRPNISIRSAGVMLDEDSEKN